MTDIFIRHTTAIQPDGKLLDQGSANALMSSLKYAKLMGCDMRSILVALDFIKLEMVTR